MEPTEQPTRRTRSGRTVKSVVRYEPEETVFEDDNDYESFSENETESELDTVLEDLDDSDADSYVSESSEESDDESSDDEETEMESVIPEDEYLPDAIVWEDLTDNAETGDESDGESDDDEL